MWFPVPLIEALMKFILVAREIDHIRHTQDLITLGRSQDPDLVSRMVERFLHILSQTWLRVSIEV